MAEINNFSEINDNFDTVKTLLNSIRAQGILNTSDVDKLLSGINAKLEKINTEEDIDIIKVFLTELKQTMDERHNALISKFSAIEALFSNLLKNSTELPKSSELKELFDVVATNLSVFSREVVSQKETLTDITLRLDAIRSDDSQKKDIIKNITLLKPDLERLNNGFDTIVLSLNDNFKTIVKTISTIDKTEYLDKFSDNLNNIEMSSKALLSAIQVVDKKTEDVEDALQNLATKSDLTATDRNIAELKVISSSMNETVGEINTHYSRIDNLADKIDASVNIIASLKSVLEDADDSHTKEIIAKVDEFKTDWNETEDSNTKNILASLESLSKELEKINSDTKFEDFKVSMASVLKDISESTVLLDKNLANSASEINRIVELLSALDVNTNFADVASKILASETNLKNYIDENTQKITTLDEANITRVLGEISSSAEALNSKISGTQDEISTICKNNFGSIFENFESLKKIVSQIDDNGVSSYNAMFSNITDRLNMFETTLKESLDNQENSAATAATQLYEQVDNIKNLSGVLDYKMDSSVVEISNMTRNFEGLKSSIDEVLALNFVETVKDLRADLYASKQEMALNFENSNNTLSEKVSNDLYGKYELIISKLDTVEEEFKKTQISALSEVKEITDKISSSIVDVLSYVSTSKKTDNSGLEKKIDGFQDLLKDTNLNYVESVRDIVDLIRVQVEANLKSIEEESSRRLDQVERNIERSSEDIKTEIRNSYEKLLEVRNVYEELKDLVHVNNVDNSNNFDRLMNSAQEINAEYETKLEAFKAALLNKITEFKQEFSCENADKINEFKFAVDSIYDKSSKDITESVESIRGQIKSVTADNAIARGILTETVMSGINELKDLYNEKSDGSSLSRQEALNKILSGIDGLSNLLMGLSSSSSENRSSGLNDIFSKFDSLKSYLTELDSRNADKRTAALTEVSNEFDNLKEMISSNSNLSTEQRAAALSKINDNFDNIRDLINKSESDNTNARNSAFAQITGNFDKLIEIINKSESDNINARNNVLEQIAGKFDNLTDIINKSDNDNSTARTAALSKINDNFDNVKELINKSDSDNINARNNALEQITEKFDDLTEILNKSDYDNSTARTAALSKILENIIGLKEVFTALNNRTVNAFDEKVQILTSSLESLKEELDKIDENIDGDMTRQLSIIESNFESLISQMSILFEKSDQTLTERINSEFSDISERMNTNVTRMLESYKTKIEETFDRLGEKAESQSTYLQERVADINSAFKFALESQSDANYKQLQEIENNIRQILDENIEIAKVDYTALREKISDFASEVETQNNTLVDGFKERLDDITKYIDSVLDIQNQEASVRNDEISAKLSENSERINSKADNIISTASEQLETARSTRAELSDLRAIADETKAALSDVRQAISDEANSLTYLTSEMASKEVKTIEEASQKLSEQMEASKVALEAGKTFLSDFMQKEISAISDSIEKETDVIFSELVEQFDNLKKAQADESVKITTGIEDIVANQIYTNIEDLKSYLDFKTDNSALSEKLDLLKNELSSMFNDTVSNLNKMLASDVFTSAISDFRAANEILISSTTEKINDRIEDFINSNSTDIMSAIAGGNTAIEEKLSLFDKKFIDTVVDKFEEIKLLSNEYNNSFDNINSSFNLLLSDFGGTKDSIAQRINELEDAINISSSDVKGELQDLKKSFDGLRTQISSKSFDEAFQASINKQIASLESLVKEQFGYLEDIGDLCNINLPEVSEISVLMKNSILTSINDFSAKLEGMDVEGVLERELKSVKNDVITQILNIFNQISFVTEQEEILDFIQEKHDELIDILSHVVTTEEDMNTVKNSVLLVDDKLSTVKDEISSINEKINSIISSDGDIDYIYSLQDLEADIANLRLVLQSMKDSTELSDLADSTEKIYSLLESVKAELPDKHAFDGLSENLESISTRTNKLILASDESYKTLQENLQDFKLVIDDLDERTKNFSRESGMDRIDSKLNALNTMIKNGEKTSQTFNQVFEYLAEWVDNAGNQITAISDKVETLDEIGQIKVMLEDLKAESQDNSESLELIEALGNVFDKQAKKISSLETKLDRMIVETTISNKNNKIDLSPMENTLNKFLVAIGDKISSQQSKIDSLESKLEKVMDVLDEKGTAQLTKKVGGMDRQIAKLNKSIEKIASHVVER